MSITNQVDADDVQLSTVLTYAEHWPLFPCGKDKKPLVPGGFHAATKNREQLRQWYREFPDCMWGVGLGAAGLCVIDDDRLKKGLQVDDLGLPPTFTTRTATGGTHYWFTGDLPNTAGKLAEGVDTRGSKGYVVVPPSVGANGERYTIVDDADYAELPAAVAEKLAASTKVRHREATSTVELDADQNVVRAVAYLKTERQEKGPPIEGYGSDDRIYRVCTALRDMGISAAKSAELIKENLAPDFDFDWLETKAANVNRYAQNEPGVHAAGLPSETFKSFTGPHIDTTKPKTPVVNDNKLLSTPGDWRDLPPPSWLYRDVIPEQGVVLVNGKSQSFKSFFVLDLLAGIASNTAALGTRRPNKSGVAIYIPSEGKHTVKTLRVPALEKGRHLDLDNGNFAIYERMPQVGEPEQIDELIRAVELFAADRPVRAICFDTLAGLMGGMDENAAKDMGLVVAMANKLKDHFGCVVIIVSHPPKAAADDDPNARGSGSSFNGVDTFIQLSRHREGGEFVSKVQVHKQKDAEVGPALFIEGEKIDLGVNSEGEPLSSLVFNEANGATIQAAADNLQARVLHALRRLDMAREIGPQRTAATLRVAHEMLMVSEGFPEFGMRVTGEQERRRKTLTEQLRRSAEKNPAFRALAMKQGVSKTAPYVWNLPPEERVPVDGAER
jgi:hypothetical protein